MLTLLKKIIRKKLPKDKIVELPNGRIVEGTNSLQICCPICDYGEGFYEGVLPLAEKITITCPTCKTKFIGLENFGNTTEF